MTTIWLYEIVIMILHSIATNKEDLTGSAVGQQPTTIGLMH